MWGLQIPVRHVLLGKIDDAFRQRKFERDYSASPTILYRGTLRCGGVDIPVACEIDDINLVRYPKIRIDPGARIPPGVIPHLGEDREFCYLERGSNVLDLYNPDMAIIRCLDLAEKALHAAIKGTLNLDVAAEFGAYWSRVVVFVNLPKIPENGVAKIVWYPDDDNPPDGARAYLVGEEGLPAAITRHFKSKKIEDEPCYVLTTDKSFTARFGDPQWPPGRLEDLLSWLADYVDDIEGAWEKISRSGVDSEWWIALRAANGTFLARIVLPAALRRQEFVKSRRGSLSKILERTQIPVPVKRYLGKPIDAQFIFGRNLHGMRNLKDKKILLIGCGTIGGFLAHQLCLSGAGNGEGSVLTLVDSDDLSTSNLGRHYLGIKHVGRKKAAACKAEIDSAVPYVNVRNIDADALTILNLLDGFDLVIDATGDDAFSIALNDYAVLRRRQNSTFPPVLHVWVAANGGAAAALLCDSLEQGCFKCLQPDLFGLPRTPIAKNREKAVIRNQACGDAPYTPFPVSSSVQAAALALEISLDWVNGKVGRRHRIRTFDDTKAFIRADRNVPPHKDCPACRRSSP